MDTQPFFFKHKFLGDWVFSPSGLPCEGLGHTVPVSWWLLELLILSRLCLWTPPSPPPLGRTLDLHLLFCCPFARSPNRLLSSILLDTPFFFHQSNDHINHLKTLESVLCLGAPQFARNTVVQVGIVEVVMVLVRAGGARGREICGDKSREGVSAELVYTTPHKGVPQSLTGVKGVWAVGTTYPNQVSLPSAIQAARLRLSLKTDWETNCHRWPFETTYSFHLPFIVDQFKHNLKRSTYCNWVHWNNQERLQNHGVWFCATPPNRPTLLKAIDKSPLKWENKKTPLLPHASNPPHHKGNMLSPTPKNTRAPLSIEEFSEFPV